MRILARAGLRRVRPLVLAACAIVLLVAGAFAATLLPFLDDDLASLRPTRDVETVGDALDADRDGLPDAVENRVGSDPQRHDSLGAGVADGWIHHWYGGIVDWNDTSLLSAPTLVPPRDALPPPLQADGALAPPTVAQLYAFENATRTGEEEETWWRTGSALDPSRWDNDGDGVADAWLVQHGLDPFAVDPAGPSPGDERMTVQQKYDAGLDPTVRDTDGDGLDDVSELAGTATIGGTQAQFEPTDPRAFSTRADAIPDGYLVRFGLNPHDASVGDQSPAGDGLNVRTAYQASLEHCRTTQDPCDVPRMVANGLVVDPTTWDTLGDGIADAWSLADPTGVAHPLVDGRSTTVFSTAGWDEEPWTGPPATMGYVEDEHNPPPEPHELTLLDLYTYQRPAGWDEARDGAWWDGIPTDLQAPDGSLPPAVSLRGWNITVETCRGCNETRPATEAQTVLSRVFADPRNADTDSDGLTDLEEYFGLQPDGGAASGRTDPSNPDTDGDGLGDLDETSHWGTDPLRRDSSGSFLSDGEEAAYWTARHDEAVELMQSDFEEAKRRFGWLVGPGGTPGDLNDEAAFRLHPLGSVLGATPNILSQDSDGDGLTDGAELQPNRFLDMPSSNPRPSTDPARTDSDGDNLPDAWEVRWSQDLYFDCLSPCTLPSEVGPAAGSGGAPGFSGWPIDPSMWNSFTSDSDAPGDAEMNLAGDVVDVAPGAPPKGFSNGLAYRYDLHPFQADSDGDGLSDMFEIHWGVEGIPGHAQQALEQMLSDDPDALAWVGEQADRLGSRMPPEATDRPRFAVLDPSSSDEELGAADDLTGRFFSRQKGTWVADVPPLGEAPPSDCTVTALPGDGPRHEQEQDEVPSRVGREAPCWRWIAYPLASDAVNGTDPWVHDFDGDGLPDAWEFHFNRTAGLSAGLPSDGSQATGCTNPVLQAGLPPLEELPLIDGIGEPRSQYCLTNLDSYALGLDPRVGDTDGGGLSDWQEVALALDPLDPADDRGEEDWSGDGLPNKVKDELGLNRFSPDTDGDGLLDGDPVGILELPFLAFGEGNGDLCLRRGPDPVANMENRPPQLGADDSGGALTHTQLYEWFVSLGILHDTSPDRCPAPEQVDGQSYPYTLFKREVMRDIWSKSEPQILGAGQGSDPLRWDSSGNGIPDGWLVHWRDHVDDSTCVEAPGDGVRRALDPNDPGAAQEAPHGTSVLHEYLAGRPAGWDEARDGPWWGGTDPTCRDTDGDEGWFASSFSGDDALDGDWDGTGVGERTDPAPGLGAWGDARVTWSEDEGRYQTNYSSLWPFLRARAHAFTADGFDADGDDVPDFLDRARVRLDNVAVADLDSLTKGVEQTFQVTGRLVVDEAPLPDTAYAGPEPADAAGDGAGVAGATVKVILSDGASEAVLGFGVTGPDGGFAIDGTSGPFASAGPFGMDVSVSGIVFPAGQAATLPTRLSALEPGPATLRVVAEPNDPSVQEVLFEAPDGGATTAVAYKDVASDSGDQRFRIPPDDPGEQGPAMRAALLGEDDDGRPAPDTTAGHVRHAAEAVFADTSQADPLDLQALARLEVSGPPSRVRAGEALLVTGTLSDEQGVPLPGRTAVVRLAGPDGPVSQQSAEVGPDGAYLASFPTHGLEPGSYTIRSEAVLLPGDDFLQAPAPQTTNVILAQDTVWSALTVNGRPVVDGQGVEEPVSAGLEMHADLSDAITGDPVPGRGVSLRVTTVADGKQRAQAEGTTDPAGRFSVHVDLQGPLPLDSLRVDVEADTVTPADVAAEAAFFLLPVFQTWVELEDVRVPVHETGFVQGRVMREGGLPVGSALGHVQVAGPDGTFEANITDDAGTFMFPAQSPDPGSIQHSVRFVTDGHGSHLFTLQPSAPVTVNSTHFSATDLQILPAEGIRDRPVSVNGSFRLGDGRPASGPVEVRWSNGAWQEIQAETGAWSFTLPARASTGKHTVEARFAGTSLLDPAQATAEATIRRATSLDLNGTVLRGGPGGVDGVLEATLVDQDGAALAGRLLRGAVAGPDGETRPIEGATDSRGVLRLSLDDLGRPVPGEWTWTVGYPGGPREAPASASAPFEVHLTREIAIERLPARPSPGQDISIAGRIDALPGDAGETPVIVRLDGKMVGRVDAVPGEPWSVQATVPLTLGAGPRPVVATADKVGEFVQVRGAAANVSVVGDAQVHLEEAVAQDGSRDVALRLLVPAGWEDEVEITLVRRGDDGRILGVHRVTTGPDGGADIFLDAREQGQLSVVHLGDPRLRLEGSVLESHALPRAPPQDRAGTVAVAAAALVLAVGISTAYLTWVVRNRRRIEDMFDRATEALLDPDADPRTVVLRTYEELLRLLERAGYTPPDERTVRDIADEVTRAFRLPHEPMWQVSTLFERVVYSEEPLGASDRRTALSAFFDLSRQVPGGGRA